MNSMNVISNNNNKDNRISNNNNLNKINKNSNIIYNKDFNSNNSILITFKYGNNEGYINANKNQLFNDIIKILERKYKWIKPIANKKFIYLENEIQKNSTIESLNIVNKSSITVKITLI